jgi:hypothetical protein
MRRPTPSRRARGGASGASGAAAPPVERSLRRARSSRAIPPVDPSSLTRQDMSTIKSAIDALRTVSIVCGMVPVVGENPKSAVELASTICEHIQVRSHAPKTCGQLLSQNHATEHGGEPRGIRAARRSSRGTPHRCRERPSATEPGAICAADGNHAKQHRPSYEVSSANPGCPLTINPRSNSVLKEIEAAVHERLPSDPEPVRKRARLLDPIRRKATDLKRRYKDPQELEELRRKLQNVVDSLTVSTSFRPMSLMLKSCTCASTSRYPLFSVPNSVPCVTNST